jgi:hypothetical protein
MKNPPIFNVVKITQLYDPVQDRLRFNLETNNGLSISIWMTQRLLNTVVLQLTKLIDLSLTEKVGGSTTNASQAFQQSIAQSTLKKQPPVQVVDIIEMGLITAINIARKKEKHTYEIVFSWDATGKARMVMDEFQLRQWLAVILSAVRRSEWPLNCWPEWIKL